ncbi:MAG TPA: hypothetical protein V6D07_19045 [Trichocoleus sp.]
MFELSSLVSSSDKSLSGFRIYQTATPTALQAAFFIDISQRSVGEVESISLGLPRAVGDFYFLSPAFSFSDTAIQGFREVNGPDQALPGNYWEVQGGLAIYACPTYPVSGGAVQLAFLINVPVGLPSSQGIYAFDLSDYGSSEVLEVGCQGSQFNQAASPLVPVPGEWILSDDHRLSLYTDAVHPISGTIQVIAIATVAANPECGWALFSFDEEFIFEQITYLGLAYSPAKNAFHPQVGEFVSSGRLVWLFMPLEVSKTLTIKPEPSTLFAGQYLGVVAFQGDV